MAADLTSDATLLYRTGSEMNFRIGEGESRVGFDKGNEVRVPLDGVSRLHARVVQKGEDFYVEDAGSSNGTFLNGRRLTGRERLRHLDVVTLGRSHDLIFVRRTSEKRVVRRGVKGAWLEVLDGIDQGSRRELSRGAFTIGRAASCNVVADSKLVSQIHARIERTAAALMITDLQSSNGTAINGERMQTRVLKNGDVIELAGSRHYRVVLESGEVETGDVPRVELEGSLSLPMDWQTRIEWTPGEKKVSGRKPAATGIRVAKVPALLAPRSALPVPAPASTKPENSDRKPATAAATDVSAKPDAESPGERSIASVGPPAARPSPKPESPKLEPPKLEPPKPPPAPVAVAPAPPVPATPAASAPERRTSPVIPPVPPAHPSGSDPAAVLEETRIVKKMPAFHVLLEGASGSFILGRGDHGVGRLPGSAVSIQTLDVSRRHARILIEDETATVEDLQSGNGTFVNGRRLAAVERLSDGDELAFGDLKFKVRFARPTGAAGKK